MIAENEPSGGRPEEAAGDVSKFKVELTVLDGKGARVFHHLAPADSWHYETTEAGEVLFRFREAKA